MAEKTGIAWTDSTFSPWHGCERVSPACDHCYAEQMAGRNPGTLGVWGPDGTRVVAAEKQWDSVLSWNRKAQIRRDDMVRDGLNRPDRPRVFCASISDVFEDWPGDMVNAAGQRLWVSRAIPKDVQPLWFPETPQGDFSQCRPMTMQDARNRLFRLIDATPHLDWLLLTKRPENIARMMPAYEETLPSRNVFFDPDYCKLRGVEPGKVYESTLIRSGLDIYRKNVWFGTTVENQEYADKRIPELLKIPAVVRFLSIEPLLGPIDFSEWFYTIRVEHNGDGDTEEIPCRPGIHWGILGGESGGKNRREFNIGDAVSIVRQCKEAGVAMFVKQMGSVPVEYVGGPTNLFGNAEDPPDRLSLPMTDKLKGSKFEEFPPELQIRQFPTHHLAVPATGAK